MKPTTFAVWLVLALVTLAGAVAAVMTRPGVQAARLDGDPVFTELRANPDAVARITVTTAEDSFSLVREAGGGWGAEQKSGYPVDAGKVRELIVSLADTRFVEAKTSSAALLPRLELEDPAAEGAKSRRLVLAGADGKVLVEAIVGKRSTQRTGRDHFGSYLRRADREQAWLVNREIRLPEALKDWLDKEIVNIPGGAVARVEVTPAEGTRYQATRAEYDGDMTLAPVPEGPLPEGKAVDQAAVKRVAAGLSYLNLDDVAKAGEVAFPESPDRARYTTLDGVVVEVEVATIEETSWVRFAVREAEPAAAEGAEATGESAGTAAEGPPETAVEASAEAAAAPGEAAAEGASESQAAPAGAETGSEEDKTGITAAALAARTEGWVYAIPTYAADRFRTPLDKLVKDPEGS